MLLRAVPRLMDSPEAIAEQIFCIQTFDLLHLFREMTFWGVIAEHMFDDGPRLLTATDNPALELDKWLGIAVLDSGSCQNLPDVPAQGVSNYMDAEVFGGHTRATRSHHVPSR
jgi:hypothetical protein